jgi:hypothetical protein
MEPILNQTKECLGKGFFYPALITCLTIPDMCGAIDSKDGRSTGEKYQAWYDKYVCPALQEVIEEANGQKLPFYIAENGMGLNGKECWIFRCSLLHQGTTLHEKSSYERILFIDPRSGIYIGHGNVINNMLHIDLKIFCDSVLRGAQKWLTVASPSEQFKKNYNNSVRLYENGFAPFKDIPVVT